MAEFRSLLLSLGRDILKDDLDSMKFYFQGKEIGGATLEKITNALGLFQALERLNLLGPDNRTHLAKALKSAGRTDLHNKLLGIEDVAIPSARTVPNAPLVTGALNESHLDEISDDLGRDWKRLGRMLIIKESVIDSIDCDNRRVKEKAMQVMLRWKRENGINATGQILADALTTISRKDIAELLADKCNNVPVQNVPTLSPPVNVAERSNQGPLETTPTDLRPHLPAQESKDDRRKKKDLVEEHQTDSPSDVGPSTDKPSNTEVAPKQSDTPSNPAEFAPITQEQSAPVQPLLGILDPNRYFVFEKIGDGSCGKVYRCQTKDGAHTYAVKQVLLKMNDKEVQKQVKRLKKEIELLKKLKHPYIVTYFHAEDNADALSIFMEYLRKGSIYDHLLNNGVLVETLVRKYTYQILKGCEYLHQQHVIHMDIKGANVLLDNNDNIRLVDFGISKELGKIMTITTSFRGTIYWSSPEHFKESESPAFYFDIWSIGCTVVEMLTGKPPNYRLDGTQAMFKIANRDVHPPEHLTQLAKTFIEKCFEEKDKRPNATAMLEDDFPTENPHSTGE